MSQSNCSFFRDILLSKHYQFHGNFESGCQESCQESTHYHCLFQMFCMALLQHWTIINTIIKPCYLFVSLSDLTSKFVLGKILYHPIIQFFESQAYVFILSWWFTIKREFGANWNIIRIRSVHYQAPTI